MSLDTYKKNQPNSGIFGGLQDFLSQFLKTVDLTPQIDPDQGYGPLSLMAPGWNQIEGFQKQYKDVFGKELDDNVLNLLYGSGTNRQELLDFQKGEQFAKSHSGEAWLQSFTGGGSDAFKAGISLGLDLPGAKSYEDYFGIKTSDKAASAAIYAEQVRKLQLEPIRKLLTGITEEGGKPLYSDADTQSLINIGSEDLAKQNQSNIEAVVNDLAKRGMAGGGLETGTIAKLREETGQGISGLKTKLPIEIKGLNEQKKQFYDQLSAQISPFLSSLDTQSPLGVLDILGKFGETFQASDLFNQTGLQTSLHNIEDLVQQGFQDALSGIGLFSSFGGGGRSGGGGGSSSSGGISAGFDPLNILSGGAIRGGDIGGTFRF
jgi:hypothetical protein